MDFIAPALQSARDQLVGDPNPINRAKGHNYRFDETISDKRRQSFEAGWAPSAAPTALGEASFPQRRLSSIHAQSARGISVADIVLTRRTATIRDLQLLNEADVGPCL